MTCQACYPPLCRACAPEIDLRPGQTRMLSLKLPSCMKGYVGKARACAEGRFAIFTITTRAAGTSEAVTKERSWYVHLSQKVRC